MCNLTRLRSMALDSSGKQPEQQQQQPPRASPRIGEAGLKLRKTPNEEHEPDSYDDLQLDFSPVMFSSLGRYLPEQVLNSSRKDKAHFMRDLLLRYSPDTERIRIQKHREYREKILSSYQVNFCGEEIEPKSVGKRLQSVGKRLKEEKTQKVEERTSLTRGRLQDLPIVNRVSLF